MTVSIVLSTYNGEKYIQEQLQSLYKQSYKPDKVYITDDCSTDRTIGIIRGFIDQHNLKTWKLIENGKNQGWKKNFLNLLKNTEEECVFLCDQDDIWDHQKIEIITEQMETHPECELIACGYTPLYEDRESHINPLILNTLGTGGDLKQIPLNDRFMDVLRPGCCMAVRQSLIRAILPFWNDHVAHDAMLWRYSTLRQTGYILGKNLIMWRRYSNSSSNPLRDREKKDSQAAVRYRHCVASYQSHLDFYDSLQQYVEKNPVSPETQDMIRDNITFESKYLDALTRKSVCSLVYAGMRYRKKFSSVKTIVGDVLCTFAVKVACRTEKKG